MIGWKCPGCGACYSPFVSQCQHCQPKAIPATHTIPLQPFDQRGGTSAPLPKPPETTCGLERRGDALTASVRTTSQDVTGGGKDG